MRGSIPACGLILSRCPRNLNSMPHLGLLELASAHWVLDELEALCGNAGTETGLQRRVEGIMEPAGGLCCRGIGSLFTSAEGRQLLEVLWTQIQVRGAKCRP